MPALPARAWGIYFNPGSLFPVDEAEVALSSSLERIASELGRLQAGYVAGMALLEGKILSPTEIELLVKDNSHRNLSTAVTIGLHAKGLETSARLSSVVANVQTQLRADLADGSNVIIVSHSQGNIFANLVFSILSPSERNRVRFVGVAVPSETTPNNRYLTLAGDFIINTLYDKILSIVLGAGTRALPANFEGYYDSPPTSICPFHSIKCIDYIGHNFGEVYLNPLVLRSSTDSSQVPAVVVQLIGDSIKELASDLPPTSCKGASTILGQWTHYGTATFDTTTNTYRVGDLIFSDPGDSDGDCNLIDSFSERTTGQDNDWLVYNRRITADVDFSADACISFSPRSAHVIALGIADLGFTGLPKSGHQPVVGEAAGFSVQWNTGRVLGYTVPGAAWRAIPSATYTPGVGFCGKYRLTRVGATYSAYFNDSLVGSGEGTTAPVLPWVVTYDDAVVIKPTVVISP